MASGANTISGSYVGTGAALEIRGEKVGFKPRRVSIYRRTTRQDKVEHFENLGDGEGILDKGDDGVRSLISAQGITPVVDGFTLGTNASVNNSGDTYDYTCEA